MLLLNLIEINNHKYNTQLFVAEIKTFIKTILNNYNTILKNTAKCKLTTIKHIENSQGNHMLLSNHNSWNSKLFTDVANLVQKICYQKQINPSNEKAILCILEVYDYFNRLSKGIDP